MITRTFKLCLNAGTGSAPYINVSQYDEGETWLFELYSETGERYIPSTGAIVGVKSDGHGIVNTGTVDSDGRVVITETQQMTASAGRAIYELSIDGLTHGTANFIVAVERKPTDDAVMSDSDLSLIQEAIDSAEVIVDVIGDGDPSEVIGEHVDAWLDNHPEATTTVLDGAITAPKINQSLWDKLLVSEEASGAVASFDDGADDVPVSSLKVALEPIQTGTGDPSPSNVRPIYPANSGNVLDSYGANTANGYVSGSYLANTGSTYESTNWYITEYIPVFANHVMNIKNAVGNAPAYCFYDENKAFISGASYSYSSSITVTVPATARYMRLSNTSANSAFQLIDDRISVLQTGRNLLPPFVFNFSWESGNATVVGTGDGAYTLNGTTTGYQQAIIQSDIHLKAGTYTFGVTVEASGTPVPLSVQLRNVSGGITYAIASWNTSQSQTFTLTEDTAVRMRFVVQSALTFNNVIFKPHIEYGSKASEYEPFISTIYPYTLGQSVYGGTVDLATGVLTVNRGYVDLGGTDWNNADASGWTQQVLTIDDAVFVPNSQVADIYCDAFVKASANDVYNKVHNNSICINSSKKMQIYCTAIASMSGANIKTYLTGHYLIYKLATPTTVQLTPQEVKTLLGYNNISSTGTVEVIYHADTKLYVDKMTAVDNAIIAPTEADYVATRNYTVNDLVIVNDTLYKVTANIQNGGTITPNSNVTQTTLSALIKALS